MAGDLDPSTAAWGTSSLLLASGDSIDGATGGGWGSQVAKNTGWLYYRTRHALSVEKTIVRGELFSRIIGYVYLPAGTYSIYGLVDADGVPEGNGYLKFYNETVVTWTDDAATTGALVGWHTDTGGWFFVSLVGSADADPINVLAAVSYRPGEYDPEA